MWIVDGHLDLAWNALQWGRDLSLAAHVIRAQEAALSGKARGLGTVSLPDLSRGRVGICFATLLARSTGRAVPHIDFPNPAQAFAAAQGQLAYYRALESQGLAVVLTDRTALDDHVQTWEAWDASGADTPPPLGLVLSMEGADPILAPDQLEAWYAAGLRIVGLTHYGSGRYAGGTGVESGLTAAGRALLPELHRLGFGLDLTHCSDAAFWQVLERYEGAVHASHQNCRALVPHQRQFSDEQIRAIAARDGVIGVALDAWMLASGWMIGDRPDPRNPPVGLADVVDQIDHICQVTGTARHVAIGSDLDGGFGREQVPADLDTIADLPRIAGLLAERGYPPDAVAAIMHGNWLRWLRALWSKS
jgi:membrane dipeptidase